MDTITIKIKEIEIIIAPTEPKKPTGIYQTPQKKAYDKNYRNSKYNCACGAKNLTLRHKKAHEQTNKHQKWLKNNKNN